LLLCSSHLNLGVTNSQAINKFSGAVAGEEEDFCKGSLSHSIFYFVIVLLYFIFPPAATWNLHTTQPGTLLLTYDEVVNLTGLL
jgi:hypothetical protein